MTRIVPRIVLLLLLGAVVNIVVAWACSIWAPLHRPGTGIHVSISGDERWPIWNFMEPESREIVPRIWPLSRSGGPIGSTLGDSEERATGSGLAIRAECASSHATIRGGANSFDHTLIEIRAGWPAHSLVAQIGGESLSGPAVGSTDPGAATPADWHGGLSPPAWLCPSKSDPLNLGTFGRVLPFTPQAGGFAINTLAYAASLAVLLTGFVLLVRVVRTRRGLCPYCAYDLSGNTTDVCPECGHPVKPLNRAKLPSSSVIS